MVYSDLVRTNVLNIFTDASIKKVRTGFYGCYGAVATVNDTMIDCTYRILTSTTSNHAEIMGVGAGVDLALRYRYYPIINIFSDSQLCIFGLRDRLVNWQMGPNGLVTKQGGPVANQEVFMEIVYTILENNLHINFFHVKGHVDPNNIQSVRKAELVFKSSNRIREKVDLNIVRYLGRWNDIVDKESRHRLNLMDKSFRCVPAIYFNTEEFDRERYYELTRNTMCNKNLGEPLC